MPMVLFPDTVNRILAYGGAVRISAKGLMPNVMEQYAGFAKSGGGHVTFVVGDAVMMPDVMLRVAGYGKGHVTFDFVSRDGWE